MPGLLAVLGLCLNSFLFFQLFGKGKVGAVPVLSFCDLNSWKAEARVPGASLSVSYFGAMEFFLVPSPTRC
jgi:hypothetical protein